MEKKAILPSPDSYKNELFTGKCAELSMLGTTIPDLLCSSAVPCEHRDLVSLSRKIMNHNSNILQQFRSGSSLPVDFTESKNCLYSNYMS